MSDNMETQLKEREDELVQNMVELEATDFHSELESEEAHKNKFSASLRESVKNYQDQISRGFTEIFESKKLEEADYNEIMEKFKNYNILLDELDPKKTPQDYLQLGDYFYKKSTELANELLEAQEYERAYNVLTLLFSLKPDESQYATLYGLAALQIGNYETALVAFYQALQNSDIETPLVMLLIADTLKAMGEEEDAKDVVQQVIDLVTGEEEYTDVLEMANSKLAQLAA